MTLTTVSLNGIAIEDLGLVLCGVDGWHDIPKRTYPTMQVPLIMGARAMASGSVVESRTLPLKFLVRPASFTNRQAQIDALVAQFPGTIEVATVDAPDRVSYGTLRGMTVTTKFAAFANADVTADCQIECDDPLWYDRTPVLTWIPSGTRKWIVMGTGPARRMLIRVQGAATNPVVILRDQTGTEVQRMTLTGAPSSTQWIEINCDAAASGGYMITRQPDGEDVIQDDWLGASETFFSLREPYQYTLECAQAALFVSHVRTWIA
ncbi:MAG TPA: hypothetical protein VIR54_27030 [Vicinamibacterales bacterium]